MCEPRMLRVIPPPPTTLSLSFSFYNTHLFYRLNLEPLMTDNACTANLSIGPVFTTLPAGRKTTGPEKSFCAAYGHSDNVSQAPIKLLADAFVLYLKSLEMLKVVGNTRCYY